MDCEKFETTMIDELYGELDELTSAAAKRHVSGCARCSALLGGLRATRRVAVLPLIEPPDDLEERILTAAKNAQKVVPLKSRVARAVSRAGSWAMRPQTAMAALFLVMVGSSAMLLRGRQAKAPATSSVTVTDQGAPAAAPMASLSDPANQKEDESAANAHGAPAKPTSAASIAAATATAAPADGENQRGDIEKKGGLARSASPKPNDDRDLAAWSGNASVPGGVPNTLPQTPYQQGQAQSPPPPPAAAAAPTATAGPAGGGYGGYDNNNKDKSSAGFNNAMAAYNAGRYDDAARLFGTLAANSSNAGLWEARSMREGSAKCRGAVAKFDLVAQRAAGTADGNDAKLEGARCYRVMGQTAAATQRLNELLSVPSHADRAKQELQSMSNAAGAKAPAKAAPSAAPAAPAPNTKSDSSYRQ